MIKSYSSIYKVYASVILVCIGSQIFWFRISSNNQTRLHKITRHKCSFMFLCSCGTFLDNSFIPEALMDLLHLRAWDSGWLHSLEDHVPGSNMHFILVWLKRCPAHHQATPFMWIPVEVANGRRLLSNHHMMRQEVGRQKKKASSTSNCSLLLFMPSRFITGLHPSISIQSNCSPKTPRKMHRLQSMNLWHWSIYC